MSAHNAASQLEDSSIVTTASSGKVMNWSAAAPAGSEIGWVKGAIWVVTGSSANSGSTRLFINSGSSTSASWVAITTAS